VTKKEIVKQISERIGLTQLKTKDIVQQTFDAIVDTLLEAGRIELRNFGVFEVKQRKARKARNPRTGDKVDVPPKNVVTFKPGKEMEERVRRMQNVPVMTDEEDNDDELGNHIEASAPEGNGQGEHDAAKLSKVRKPV
jgi:integration host factor subunit beta